MGIFYGQTLRDQTVPCKRIPQQAKIRFVAEPATLLPLFNILRCIGFHKQLDETLFRS